MNTRSGAPTSALYGFSVLLVKLLRECAPDGIGFALDSPGGSFRNRAYRDYKAGRSPTPPDLAAQLTRFRELGAVLGAPMMAAIGFEADDVLATAAARLADRDREVVVVSGDRDLFQVVSDRVSVRFVGRRGQDHVVYDLAKIADRYGVEPEMLPTVTALVGDKADNLPGLDGVGVATAGRWCREYGRVADIVAAAERLRPKRLRPVVAAAAAELSLSEDLARLRTDVRLADPVVGPIGAAQLADLGAWFETLEFTSLLPRLRAVGPM